jgi:hypothetical protein
MKLRLRAELRRLSIVASRHCSQDDNDSKYLRNYGVDGQRRLGR